MSTSDPSEGAACARLPSEVVDEMSRPGRVYEPRNLGPPGATLAAVAQQVERGSGVPLAGGSSPPCRPSILAGNYPGAGDCGVPHPCHVNGRSAVIGSP